MKSRWYFWSFFMIAGFLVILVLSSMIGNTGMTTLSAEIPELLQAGNFEARILWDGEEIGIPVLLTDDQFLSALVSTEVREKNSFEAIPSPAIEMHFSTDGEDCCAVVSKEGAVSLAKVSDPEGSRRFFLDRTGNIFRFIYEEHLLSGGMKIPEEA